jgi:pimeloyl-ACP methyl ester carboxylesterase
VLDDATEFALGDAQARDTGICGEQIGPNRNNYTTVASVLDIEAIRRELGLEAPSLIGFSYGTFMAQTYTTLFPNEVRGTVLDGAFPIEQTGWGTDIPTHIETVLGLRCERTGACPDGAEAVAESIRTVAAALARSPMDLPSADQQLTEGGFASVIQFAVQNSELEPFVTMMSAAADGDFTELNELALANFATPPVGPTSYSPALFSAIGCNDYVAQFDFAYDVAARRRDFEHRLDQLPDNEFGLFSKQGWIASGWEEGDMCLEWPTPDIAPELRIPRNVQRPGVPVLVVNGDIDLQTPLPGARQVASIFPNSVLLTVPNAGHVALPVSECAANIEFAFLVDPILPAANACANQPVPD